jgi:hypothetical protein
VAGGLDDGCSVDVGHLGERLGVGVAERGHEAGQAGGRQEHRQEDGVDDVVADATLPPTGEGAEDRVDDALVALAVELGWRPRPLGRETGAEPGDDHPDEREHGQPGEQADARGEHRRGEEALHFCT